MGEHRRKADDTPPLYLFDMRSVFAADLAAELDGLLPDLSLFNGVRVWRRDVAGADMTERLLRILDASAVTWTWIGSARELGQYVRVLRRVLDLPLCGLFHQALTDCLDLAEQEARRLLRIAQAPSGRHRFEPWEDADLIEEVTRVAGAGGAAAARSGLAAPGTRTGRRA